MKSVGIICEYNPFHNGHLYHINKVKELYPDHKIILVMSGYFTQRGEISILTKWEKTKIAIEAGVDIVIELPLIYATESADTFALGAVKILNELKVEYLVFGSECDDIEKLSTIASLELENDLSIKHYLDLGYNYPTALSLSIKEKLNIEVSSPNDLLGICYIKAIKKLKSNIIPISILRTSDYFNSNLDNNIISANDIRKLLKEKKSVANYIPNFVSIANYYDQNDLFKYFKYKVLTDSKLDEYLGVDEGIGNLITKHISDSESFDELISKIKTKRYTYNRLSRIYIHILLSITKKESEFHKKNLYIRLLGFNKDGQKYLNSIKKDLNYPLIVKYCQKWTDVLELDLRTTKLYSLLNNKVLKEEYQNSPIKKV